MNERWAGITVSSDVTIVVAEFNADATKVIEDQTWRLQQGERSSAYSLMYARILNYLREYQIGTVTIKGSAVSKGGMKLAHLEAAEVRGVVISAAAESGARVILITKSLLSRTFGERNADDYISDDSFWQKQSVANLRKGSREAMLLILSARK